MKNGPKPTSAPRLRPHLRVTPHGDNKVELRDGVWNPKSVFIEDESRTGLLYRLLLGLDGSRDVAELAHANGISKDEVREVVEYLEGLDVLEEINGPARTDTLLPWLSSEADWAFRRVVLAAEGDLAGRIEAALREGAPQLRIEQAAGSSPWAELDRTPARFLTDEAAQSALVAALEPYRDALIIRAAGSLEPWAMLALNRVAYLAGVSVLFAAIDGPFLFVGPSVLSRSGPCAECLEHRVTLNLRSSDEYLAFKTALAKQEHAAGTAPSAPARRHSAPADMLLASHVALEALRICSSGAGHLRNKVLSIYLPTMETLYNEVLPVPGCETCGSGARRQATALYVDDMRLLLDEGDRP
jgi:bacteriocin biosynthesis cyclodehydratase domain-containing protein